MPLWFRGCKRLFRWFYWYFLRFALSLRQEIKGHYVRINHAAMAYGIYGLVTRRVSALKLKCTAYRIMSGRRACARAYITVIARNPKAVAEALAP